MKKFFSFAAVAALLLSGCVKENLATVEKGEKVTVTFTTELPIEVSRAYVGDGTKADVVKYGIYNHKTGELYPDYDYQDLQVSGKVARLTLDLVKGLEYRIAFWAQNSNAPYTFDRVAKTVTADYSNVDANDEILDAFFSIDTILVKGPITKSVVLRRPFAQINLGATKADVAAAAALGVEIDETTVEVTDVYSTMNLLDGSIDKTNAATVSFKLNAIPGNDLHVNGVDYEYLAANYIFAEAETSVTDLTFAVYQNGNKINEASVPAVNYKRNYRTNILGRLLTSAVDYTIVIDGTPEGDLGESWVDENGNPILEEPTYVAADPVTGEEAHYSVSNASQLAWLAALVNGDLTQGIQSHSTRATEAFNISLYSDIDLQGVNWTPIGSYNKPFVGKFNGNGFTVKNLKVVNLEEQWCVGLFGEAENATLENLVIENVNINVKVGGHIGALVGGLESNSVVSNVTVKGDVKIEGDLTNVEGSGRIAAVIGGNEYGSVVVKDVHVVANEGSYVKGNNSIGGIAGQLNNAAQFENCSSNIDVLGGRFFAGGIVGLTGNKSSLTNCHTSGDVCLSLGRVGNANDYRRVGGIAGGWDDNVYNPLVLDNCSYTGEIYGQDAEGNEAPTYDFAGYVGRGYSINGRNGSKVIVNGVEYVQVAAGKYAIDGATVVATADELIAALEAKENVVFANNIKIDPASMSNAYGKTGINVKDGQSIDGAGYTLDIRGAGGTWDSGICTSGGVIKNLKVTGSFRGVFVKEGNNISKVILDNVVVDGTTYTISVDKASKQGIEAKNSTFNGWTSYAATIGEVSFTKCSFGLGNGYKFCRPYATTTFVDCDFCEGYTVDPVSAAVVSFDGCTLNGVALTAENIATLVTNTAKVVSVK